MFRFVSAINRDVTRGVAEAIDRSFDEASFTGLFDTIGAAVAQQFVLVPYYFTTFHQNKERHLLREITRQQEPKDARSLRIGLFTDTFDEVNGVARFVRDMSEQAQQLGRHLTVHTCSESPRIAIRGLCRKNFVPLLSRPLPYYDHLRLNLPPLLEILEWGDAQQFDAVHVSTPGPMGLCGWLVAKMLRVPLVATYHTDFPAYLDRLARDHRVTNGTVAYMKWFYAGQMSAVFSRSSAYRFNLRDLGVAEDRLRAVVPGVNTEKFNPTRRDSSAWADLGVREPRKLLYVGRISVEKNLPLLAEAFKRLCAARRDTALVLAGAGPYLEKMRQQLAGLPACFLGAQDDARLGVLYASSDLFVFPSRTDTLGQVVMEAQSSGLPALVSNEGGPKELVEHDASGLVLTSNNPQAWCEAIEKLLDDEPRRLRMSAIAASRAGRYSLAKTFESFWSDHVAVVEPPVSRDEASPALVPSPSWVPAKRKVEGLG